MSNTNSLDALHGSTVFFTDNDFEDDAAIDLTATTPPPAVQQDVQYPTLPAAVGEVSYPNLPRTSPSQPPSSSAGVPWSPSPAEHFFKPGQGQHILRSPEGAEVRPSKRRIPWEMKEAKQKQVLTPLPPNKANSSSYPWDKTASAVKNEQKELRKRNRARTQQAKPDGSKLTTKHLPAPFLSDEQRHILKAVVDDGKSVFFTGSAGTGKSVLMRSIIAKLRDKYRREPDRVAVTASTGLAACNIEGVTLHSFSGIGIGREAAPELIKKIKRNAGSKQKWLRTKVLIIDEISMVDGDLYDKLEQIARAIRNNGRPFGGIQLVITGDFFQLPPVPEKGASAKFCFEAATWNTTIEHTILLSHVFRQKDPGFASMLNEMRLGKMSPASVQAFKALSRPLKFSDDVECTELFPTRSEVDFANNSRMKALDGQEMVFEAADSGGSEPAIRAKILSNFMAQEKLILKKGSQVMLIKNLDSGLVNGSTGRVISFMNESDYSVYTDNEDLFLQSQEPEDVGDTERNRINAKARAAIQAMRFKGNAISGRVFPLVRFVLQDNTSRDLLCVPEEFKTEAPGGEIIARRVQVPLILAWALSIHKAQGQTLDRVRVNLHRVFERGQAYVALSRATSKDGLEVKNFDPKKVMVHDRVIDFYKNLVNIETALQKNGMPAGGTAALDDEKEFGSDDDEEGSSYTYG